MNIADLREEYSRQQLDEHSVESNPLAQFKNWFQEALDAKSKEANAMTLSTVSSDGQPHGRIVLLKGIENGSFAFFTNYQSGKGHELDANNKAALTFFWAELERQVRVEGVVTRIGEAESTEYFHSRPAGSQIGAWVSQQSTEIPNRQYLEKKTEEFKVKFEGVNKIPKPVYWGGYQLAPHRIEFWQGRPSRLHDRILFEKAGNAWGIKRLSP